jgi:hypothetical protein
MTRLREVSSRVYPYLERVPVIRLGRQIGGLPSSSTDREASRASSTTRTVTRSVGRSRRRFPSAERSCATADVRRKDGCFRGGPSTVLSGRGRVGAKKGKSEGEVGGAGATAIMVRRMPDRCPRRRRGTTRMKNWHGQLVESPRPSMAKVPCRRTWRPVAIIVGFRPGEEQNRCAFTSAVTPERTGCGSRLIRIIDAVKGPEATWRQDMRSTALSFRNRGQQVQVGPKGVRATNVAPVAKEIVPLSSVRRKRFRATAIRDWSARGVVDQAAPARQRNRIAVVDQNGRRRARARRRGRSSLIKTANQLKCPGSEEGRRRVAVPDRTKTGCDRADGRTTRLRGPRSRRDRTTP